MRIEQIDTDILLFTGDACESLATAFIDSERVLLVDALASDADALAMRDHLEGKLGKKVHAIVLTHGHSDHLAGVRLFPGAEVIAQRLFLYTFMEKRDRPAADDAAFVAPAIAVDQQMTLPWGRHTLELFHSPGKTMCSLGIDVASADLLFVADNIVGNIAYIGASVPQLIDEAIARLQRRGRSRIIPGHMGLQDRTALSNARHYLAMLGARVSQARATSPDADAAGKIRAIGIGECLASNQKATPFEQHWHAQNLEIIIERKLFALAYRAPAPAEESRFATIKRCCTVLSTMMGMFGQLAQRGL
ncbi:MBL fold metallo-hydrolase [Massilia sp. GCM10020059]|uniref:MBL fold metallo-hydrolase n=1 Tax=Massilia agrisoli TaxID=2892444 RepID=A0ABS8IVG2_9BURK|nr:MBL fold metallo-hydrolase [Massilia agrisoli]MCC6071698.1 MBL fold metallo-hydrolase [Massilia agrisoli]